MAQNKYILFRDYNTFDPELFDFKKIATYMKKDFYIITPQFTVVDYHNRDDSVILSLKFKDKDFLELIQLIDSLSILSYVKGNNLSYKDVQRNYIQTRSLNPATAQTNIMHFTIPIKGEKPIIKVFDE